MRPSIPPRSPTTRARPRRPVGAWRRRLAVVGFLAATFVARGAVTRADEGRDAAPPMPLDAATAVEPGVVVAIVLDADRRPLAGVPVDAVVWSAAPGPPSRASVRHADAEAAALLLAPRAPRPAPAAVAVSDARGEVRLGPLDTDRLYRVTARPVAPHAATTATVRARAGAQAPFVALVAPPGRTVTVRVIGLRGRAVEADVELAPAGGTPWDARASRWAGARGRATGDGRVRIDGVPRGAWRVTVRADDAVLVATRPDAGDEEVVFSLAEGADVQGVVEDDRGGPVAGARVVVAAASQDRRVVARVRAATSGPDGRYLVEGVGVDEAHVLAVEAAGLVPTPLTEAATASVPLPASGRQTVALRCEPACTVGGTVRDLDGRPVAGARVRVLDAEERRRPVEAVSDAAGTWRVDGRPTGRGTVGVEAAGFVLAAPHAVSAFYGAPPGVPFACEQAGTARDVAVVLARAGSLGATVAGTVRRADGTAAAGVLVVLDRWLEGPYEPGRVATRTDAAGRYRVDDVRFRHVHVVAQERGARAERHATPVEPGTRHVVDLALEAASSVHGVVRDGGGRPVAGVEVVARVDPGLLTGNDVVPRPVGSSVVTDADGRYALDPLDERAFVVLPVVDGRARFLPAVHPFSDPRLPWTFVAIPTVDVAVDVLVPAGGHVAGVVRHADGTPAAGVSVWAHPAARGLRSGANGGGEAVTDVAGRFRLETALPGLVVVGAGDASVTAPTGTDDLVLVVGEPSRRAVLLGTVTTEDGRPVPVARVRFEPFPGPTVAGSAFGGALRAVADERFVAGRVVVEDARDVRGAPLDVGGVEARVDGDGPVRVVLPAVARVEGRVVARDGAAVAGALVLARGAGGGDPVAWTVTDDDGGFRFVGVQPTVATVEARDAAGRASMAPVPVARGAPTRVEVVPVDPRPDGVPGGG